LTPPFPATNNVKQANISPTLKWKSICTEAERNYWMRLGYPVHVQFDDKEVPTLVQLICRKMSWVATVTETYYGLNRVINTMSTFPLKKQLALYGDFNVNTMRRDATQDYMWQLVPGALGWLNYQMKTESNFGTCYFNYNPHKLLRQFQLFRSGGIAAGGTRKGEYKGTKISVHSSGQKVYMAIPALRKLHRLLVQVRRGDMSSLESIVCVIKAKSEWKLGQFKTYKELEDMMLKIREFYIPEQSHSFLGILLNESRMLLERNNIIRIGMKFWWGGAECLYRYLNGHIPGFIYVDGDITGLDKHIQDWMLLLYCMGVYPYYDWSTLNEKDIRFLENILTVWAANVCSKLVCHIGSFWRYMHGQMYSGGKETSHGDSWIMAFLFFCYVQHIKQRCPNRAYLMDEFLSRGFITIVVYGDDHIWCAPDCLQDVMNHKTWKAFLKDHCHMTLRDENIYRSLLSVPDNTGRLAVAGPKFLKRYFIKNTFGDGLSSILPYKPIDEQLVRAMTTDSEVAAELIISLVGHAWDTQGTNEYSYDVIAEMYRRVSYFDPRTPLEILKSLDVDDISNTRLRRLIRKAGISHSEMFDHFPSLGDLRSRHVFDMKQANYQISRKELATESAMYECEEDIFC